MKCVHVCLRYFVSRVSVPLSLKKSQVVEAICILLCHKDIDPQMSSDASKVTGLQLLM